MLLNLRFTTVDPIAKTLEKCPVDFSFLQRDEDTLIQIYEMTGMDHTWPAKSRGDDLDAATVVWHQFTLADKICDCHYQVNGYLLNAFHFLASFGFWNHYALLYKLRHSGTALLY